ncbi:MAG: ABC transporter substrate-binding protein [Sandaracinaceae bacterium]
MGCIVGSAVLNLSCEEALQPDDPVRIGVLFQTSAAFGPHTRGAVHAALIVNSHGGVLGRRVEILVRDDGGRPDTARDAAADLIENEGVVALIGPLTWPTYFSVYDYASQRGIPVIGIDAGGWDRWSQDTAGGGAFSPRPGNERIYRVAARHVSTEGLCARAALLSIPMEGTSSALLVAFEEELQAPTELVYSNGMVPANIFDAEEILGPVRDANPDCVFANAGNDAAWAQLVEGWAEIGGPPVTFYSLRTRLEASRILQELRDPAIVTGNIEVAQLSNEPESAEWNWFVRSQTALFGEPPPQPWTSDFFDATAVTLLAIESAGSTSNFEDALYRVARFDGGAPSVEVPKAASDIPSALSFIRSGKDIDYRGPSGSFDLNPETGRMDDAPISFMEVVDIRTGERRVLHIERD